MRLLIFRLFFFILANFVIVSHALSKEPEQVGVWKLFSKEVPWDDGSVGGNCFLEAKPNFTLIRQHNASGKLQWNRIQNKDKRGGIIRLSTSVGDTYGAGSVSVSISASLHDLSQITESIEGYPVKSWAVNDTLLPWTLESEAISINEYNTEDIVTFFSSNLLSIKTTFFNQSLEIIDFYDATLLDQAMAALYINYCHTEIDFMSPVWTEFWGAAILLGSGEKRGSTPFKDQTSCKNDSVFCFTADEDKNAVTNAADCSVDPSKCSLIELCSKASGTSALGEKFWRIDSELQGYVDMAKIVGVTCGVAPKQIQMVQVDTCETSPAKCSMIELCSKASGTTSSGQKFWRLDAEFQGYVSAAKTIGVTCGVQLAAVANVQSTLVEKPSKAQKYTIRKALVIGNANYIDQTPLKNPINDAKAVAAKLKQVGFDVTYKEDLGVRDFGRTLSAFERNLSGSDMSLFYYAGHGIEIEKQNYLIPVDAEINASEDVRYETVMLDDAITASLNTSRLSMVLIDACRDNPFSGKVTGGNRSVGRGLSIVEVEKGNVNQIISFAASSGEVAEDGSGQNSPYASAIIDLLDKPNLEIGKMFRLVRDRVTEATGGKQKPVVNQDLSGEDIFLVAE
jgi:hypothetical protein